MARGTVVTYAPGNADPGGHMALTRAALARMLAELKGFAYGGEYAPERRYAGPLYFVPKDSLVGVQQARALGVRSAEDLYGGVVPYAFVATKAIAHPLVGPRARAPRGWSAAFAERVRDLVLPGFSAFALDDARLAGRQLLERGPVRIKLGQGLGGHGQFIVETADELERALQSIDEVPLAELGLVVEPDLEEVTTYSVGHCDVAGVRSSYCGTQCMTRDNRGGDAYGGSQLIVVRGGYDALERRLRDPDARLALAQARLFDAASAAFDGLIASRRNYDAARGRDRSGTWRRGVLEQSWRLGGASGAELAAVKSFLADPALHAVRACSTERYGDTAVPQDAMVHYRGIDPQVGPLVKYTVLEAYGCGR